MDVLILSITPTSEPKRGRNWGKGTRAGVEKKGKEVKRKKKVEFGLQERVNGLRWGQICALLPGYTTASPFHLPHAGPPCPGCMGPLVGQCQGQTQWQTKSWIPGIREGTKESRMQSPPGESRSGLRVRRDSLPLLESPTHSTAPSQPSSRTLPAIPE